MIDDNTLTTVTTTLPEKNNNNNNWSLESLLSQDSRSNTDPLSSFRRALNLTARPLSAELLVSSSFSDDISTSVFTCDSCAKVFTDPSNLQRHIRSAHAGARCHTCPDCGKAFATTSGLKQHQHIHSSVKPFRCEVCLKAYTQFSNLCRHKRMHADCRQKVHCRGCQQGFTTATSLSKHRRFCCDDGQIFPDGGGGGGGDGVGGFSPLKDSSTPTMSLVPNAGLPSPKSGHFQNPFGGFRVASGGLCVYPQIFQPPFHFPFFPQGSVPFPSSLLNGNLLFQSRCLGNGDDAEMSGYGLGVNDVTVDDDDDDDDGDVMSSPGSSLVGQNDEDAKSLKVKLKVDRRNSGSGEQNSRSRCPAKRKSSSERGSDKIPRSSGQSTGTMTAVKREIIDDVTTPDPDKDLESHRKKPGSVSESGSGSKSRSNRVHDFRNVAEMATSETLPLDLSTRPRPPPPAPPSTPRDMTSRKPNDLESPFQSHSSSRSPDSSRTPSPLIRPELPLHRWLKEGLNRLQRDPPPDYPSTGFQSLQGANLPLFPVSIPSRTLPTHSRHRDRFFPFLSPLLKGSMAPFVGSQVGAPGMVINGKVKDRYSCRFCGKVFPRSANLTRHLRTHTGEQPYKCKYCERSFSISSNLQRHVRNIHNKEKPFRCLLCDRCFGQQTNLDRHLRKHDPTHLLIAPSESPRLPLPPAAHHPIEGEEGPHSGADDYDDETAESPETNRWAKEADDISAWPSLIGSHISGDDHVDIEATTEDDDDDDDDDDEYDDVISEHDDVRETESGISMSPLKELSDTQATRDST